MVFIDYNYLGSCIICRILLTPSPPCRRGRPAPSPSCPPLRYGRRRGEGRATAQATAVASAVASSPPAGGGVRRDLFYITVRCTFFKNFMNLLQIFRYSVPKKT